MRQLLIATVLVAAACGGSTAAAPSTPTPTAGGPTVRLVDFGLEPGSVSVGSGSTITVINAGKSPHNLWIRDGDGHVLAKTPNLQPGQRASLKLDLPPGAYTDYCQEPGHESLGMKGSLTIP